LGASAVSTVFWDVGGVLLTNGWDRRSRAGAVERFGLNREEFEGRHELVVADFETGRISLDDYLDYTVFHRERAFARDAFRDFMYTQSTAHEETLALAREIAATRRWLIGTINNESLDLNEYRIETFGLRDIFAVFFSSCFVGLQKPTEPIFRLALELTQKDPGECVMIDDRALNLERAEALGLHVIHYTDVGGLRESLAGLGITAES
jgi:putative hydrolase of the HAD superfamily